MNESSALDRRLQGPAQNRDAKLRIRSLAEACDWTLATFRAHPERDQEAAAIRACLRISSLSFPITGMHIFGRPSPNVTSLIFNGYISTPPAH